MRVGGWKDWKVGKLEGDEGETGNLFVVVLRHI